MSIANKSNWEGYASVTCFCLLALIPLLASMDSEWGNTAGKVVLFVSVPAGLLFGFSGLRTGHGRGRICSILSLLLYAFAIYFVILPAFKRIARVNSLPVTSSPVTYSLMVQDFNLSDKEPSVQLGQYTVRLISIAEDGATKIQVIQTEKVLTARPGEYFESYEFGTMGLQLKSASNGVAAFFSRGCVTR